MGLFGPKRDPKKVGEHSEQVISVRFMEVGYSVLVPVGEHHRYDLVIEDANGRFWRVQCKMAWLDKRGDDQTIRFKTASSHYRGGKYNHARRGYQGQVEYFAVYSPVDHVGSSDMVLRLTMPKGRNQYGIKMAEDYEL